MTNRLSSSSGSPFIIRHSKPWGQGECLLGTIGVNRFGVGVALELNQSVLLVLQIHLGATNLEQFSIAGELFLKESRQGTPKHPELKNEECLSV